MWRFFWYRWDSRGNYGASDPAHLAGIACGANINACFKPLLGLLAQSKFIPINVVSYNA